MYGWVKMAAAYRWWVVTMMPVDSLEEPPAQLARSPVSLPLCASHGKEEGDLCFGARQPLRFLNNLKRWWLI